MYNEYEEYHCSGVEAFISTSVIKKNVPEDEYSFYMKEKFKSRYDSSPSQDIYIYS
jgi:hypothetical protein